MRRSPRDFVPRDDTGSVEARGLVPLLLPSPDHEDAHEEEYDGLSKASAFVVDGLACVEVATSEAY